MQSSTAKRYDNIGYDLSRFDKRRRVRDALANEPVATPRPLPSLDERAAVRRAERAAAEAATAARAEARAEPFRLSIFAVFAYVAVIALLVWVIYSYMTLNEMSIQTSRLKADLAALNEEAVTLQLQLERRTDLRAIEARAEQLGMTRPAADQVIYLDLSAPDHAVVRAENPGVKSDFLDGIQTLASAVFRFFE